MKTLFRESFYTDLSVIADAGLLRRIKKVIEQVEATQTFQQIPNLKRLDAKGKYYRIRAVTFVRCLNRKEIYRYFP